jgi:hypothetical protein
VNRATATRWLTRVVGSIALGCMLHTTVRVPSETKGTALVGTWRPIEYMARDQESFHVLRGSDLRGYLVYDSTGHVLFQLMRPLNEPSTETGMDRWAVDSSTHPLSMFYAFFGTFVVDHTTGLLVHRLEGEYPRHMGPTEVATPFLLRGDTLTIGRDSAQRWVFVRLLKQSPKVETAAKPRRVSIQLPRPEGRE